MTKSEKVFNLLEKNQLIAILAPKSIKDCITAYETLSPLGIVLEIVFRTETALEGIQATIQKFPDALLLAGTVMTVKQAEDAMQSGVAGIVSADYIPDVVTYSVKNDMMCIPGGLCDAGKQLSQKANLYGCDFQSLYKMVPYQWIYKLFPTVTGQMSFMSLSKPLKSVYKGLKIVYTGGISLKNLGDLVSHDPEGIFCGSAITKLIDQPAKMMSEAKKWLEIVRQGTIG